MRPSYWILCALVLVGIIALFVRFRYRTEMSALLTEPGRIEQVTWTPATNGSGTGISSKGSVVITSVTTEEQFAIVVSCKHGKFMLNPTGATAKQVFHQFKAGDSITIHYREVYHIHRDGTRELYKLDFLRAVPRER